MKEDTIKTQNRTVKANIFTALSLLYALGVKSFTRRYLPAFKISISPNYKVVVSLFYVTNIHYLVFSFVYFAYIE